MQISLFKTIITCCLILLMQYAQAQIANLHYQAHKIPDSLVQQKIIGTDTVIYIDESLLKEVYNVITLDSGRFLYIEYKYGYVRGLLIGDDSGRVNFHVGLQQKLQENASYFVSGCSCVGANSCKEMFAKGLCKSNKICVGNTCICSMPFELPKKLRAENN